MATTIEQQVALDDALVPSAQRLRIGRSNFRLPSDIHSKESTLQVVYDVLRQSPFFKAFLVTADVPEIYMQEFWATATVHQHSIRFKMDTRKHIVDLESFREMLHISPRISGQSFAELPFEEEILEFLRFLGHSTQIKTLTDVNVNKLYQPWRSFAAVINKCLTGKSTGFDSLRLSQAQILWGLYYNRNVDYGFLIWEDLVYQVEHKNQKKSNKMDDVFFSTIKVVSRHQTTQQYGAILPIELTTEDIRNSKAYKEYYACATGEAAPKPKASARKKKGGSASSTTPPTPIATPTPTTTVVAVPRLSAAAKGKQPTRATTPTEPTDVERTEAEQLKTVLRRSRQETHISQQCGSGTDEGTDVDEQTKGRDESGGDKTDESNDDDDDQDEAEKVNDDDDDEEEITKIGEQEEEESFDPIPQTPKDNEDDDNNEEDQGLRIGEGERMQEEEEADELYCMESIFTTGSTTVTLIPSPQSTMTPSIILTFTTASQLPTPPTQIPSLDLQSLPTFALVFRFEDRVKFLEDNFSNIQGIMNQYMHQQMPEAVWEAVQTQTDRLQDSIQRENDEFLKTINDNMKKIIKELSHSSKTSYAVAADLSEMELKKILIDKMEGNKSIQRSDEQQNLFKALVEAYDADKTILDTYGESAILKRRREDDDQEGPFAGSDRGSKRQREGGEHASASTPFEPATRSAGAKDQPNVQTSQHPEWFSQLSKPPTPDRDWNKSVPAAQGNAQSWISALAKQTDDRSSFN
nr:hypothetical protein [Tanacetum cinerariifolium]